MGRVIAVAQRKGGAGKTTLAISLAAAASSENVSAQKRAAFPRGNGPILVDADSQANASTWCFGASARDTIAREQSVAMLAFPPDANYLSPAHKLRAIKTREQLLEAVLPNVLRDSVVPGLRVIGSTPTVHPEHTEELLLRDLPGSLVIVDTGADTSTPIVRSVLHQADAVIVPVVCEPWSVDGYAEVFEEIRSVGRADLFAANRVRIVISRREKTRVHDVLEQSIRDRLCGMVSNTVIPKAAAIALASHRAENLTTNHQLLKAARSILRETLQIITKTEAAA